MQSKQHRSPCFVPMACHVENSILFNMLQLVGALLEFLAYNPINIEKIESGLLHKP